MKEAIITIVGFLGAGKTTLLKRLTAASLEKEWNPFVILNDYENAYLDAHQLAGQIEPNWLKPLNGSCICCNGIDELRSTVNSIPKRSRGITLIEANGTSDACVLNGFLGIGLDERFLPPIQVSVVDVKNWQKRGKHNELEANQIQVSSLIVLTHLKEVSQSRINEVVESIGSFNPSAKVIRFDAIQLELLPTLIPSTFKPEKIEHGKSHWSSCSIDLPRLNSEESITELCNKIPITILRVKGCVQLKHGDAYIYFERLPDGSIIVRPFNGIPQTGSKLLTIGPGSDVGHLKSIVNEL